MRKQASAARPEWCPAAAYDNATKQPETEAKAGDFSERYATPKALSSHPFNSDEVSRRVKQIGSTVFLATAMLTFSDDVDPLYRLGCLLNFVASILYHGSQEPALPSRPHLARLPSSDYEWACTRADDETWAHWLLKRVDKACVCFICLYTGADGSYPGVVALVSLAAGFAGMKLNEAVVAWALYLTLGQLHELSALARFAFGLGAVGGPICFLWIDRIGAWCTPYRYLWHLCCGCLISVGGALNT